MLFSTLSVAALLLDGVAAGDRFPVTPIRLLKEKEAAAAAQLAQRDIDPEKLYKDYTLSVPIDHFHNETKYEPHTDETFELRYYMDDTYYKPGGPVIILSGGETSVADRLPYMQKGILAQLANVTGAMSVLLEHRYYGQSWPVDDLTVENLRFLTTDQALADTAYFAKHVKFPGYEDAKLNPPDTPWIAYGGSYAGAFVSILRKAYPDVYFGAISSSGVTEAIWDYWRYFDGARLAGPADAIQAQQSIIDVVDHVLLRPQYQQYIPQLKEIMLLSDVTNIGDFVNVLSSGIYGLQNTNWDPAINYPEYNEYLGNISSSEVQFPATEKLRTSIELLLKATHYNSSTPDLVTKMMNFVGWTNLTTISLCSGSQDDCFTTLDDSYYQSTSHSAGEAWRSWAWQYCTEWGYLQTGSGAPAHVRPLVSRALNIHYTSEPCRAGFNLTKPADVDIINKWGGWGITYPRLAVVDGQVDPWRAACPSAPGQPQRKSTTLEPFIVIENGVHHWDENGLFPNETTANLPPQPVADAQAAEASFVQAWLKDFESSKNGGNGDGKGDGNSGDGEDGNSSDTSPSNAPTGTGDNSSDAPGAASNIFTPAHDVLPFAVMAAITTVGMTFGSGFTYMRTTLGI